MNTSDIITILSLIIAIIAIISEKNRKHLLLKYGALDISTYFVLFLLINYFVFYEEFYSVNLYFNFLYFENFGLKNPNNYAYIISLFSLFLVLYKINFSFYPASKKTKVLDYYKSLTENKEIIYVLDLVDRYHIRDIQTYIRQSKDYDPDDKSRMFERFARKKDTLQIINQCINNVFCFLFPSFKANKLSYAQYVLYTLINDPVFIILSANLRPYFFSNIIQYFTKQKKGSFPDDLVNKFLFEIISQKNFWLIKEIKESENQDYGQTEGFFNNNRIIAALIKDLSVAAENEIWRPFGEQAISEIENEYDLGINSKLFHQYRTTDLLWEYKCFLSIKFFKILIIEAIVKNYVGTQFGLYYNWHITKALLKNLDQVDLHNKEEVDTYHHFLIEEINDILLFWITLANDKQHDAIYIDIVRYTGEQINDLMLSKNFGEERKKRFLDRILRLYCTLEEKGKTDDIRNRIEKILLKPSALTKKSHPYYQYIKYAWTDFDKFPHRMNVTNEDFEYFSQLKKNVINPLGLDPNEC